MKYSRLIIKVGTNVLTDDNGDLDKTVISNLVDQIAALKKENVEIILVTSGAVGAGKSVFDVDSTVDKVSARQMHSSIGQILLMNLYYDLFRKHGLFCGQILATKEDFRGKIHFNNMRKCLMNLLDRKVVPIINENDVVSVDELMFTDNDELAGKTAVMIGAEALIILTNVDGFYTGHPDDPGTKLIEKIGLNDKKKVAKFVKTNTSSRGRGGMRSKFDIAVNTARMGIHVHLANGKYPDVASLICKGESIGTHFEPKLLVREAKTYPPGSLKPGVYLDSEVVQKAVLDDITFEGIFTTEIENLAGNFKRGDLVKVRNSEGKVIGRGITALSAKRAIEYKLKNVSKPIIKYDYLFLE